MPNYCLIFKTIWELGQVFCFHSHFTGWGNWGSQKWSYFPKVIQTWIKDRIQTKVYDSHSKVIVHHIMLQIATLNQRVL